MIARLIHSPLLRRGYRGPSTDHFDGRRFHNVQAPEAPLPHKGHVAKWLMTRRPGAWQDLRHLPPGPPPVERVGPGELRLTFINHATVLLQVDGLNVLTDPVWSHRVGPVPGLGPRRRRAPGLRLEDLPPIDLVLVSHDHYDHLDLPTLRRLESRHAPQIVTGLGNASLLRAHGLRRVHELDWWQEVAVGHGIRAICTPAQHFSSRGVLDHNRSLWASFVLQSDAAGGVFFAGDTGFGPHFHQIASKVGPLRLALLPIGAYRPRRLLQHVHLSPDEAVQAHQILRPAASVAIHYGTFGLADDGQDEPVAELRRALKTLDPGHGPFWVLPEGEGFQIPAGPAQASPSSFLPPEPRASVAA